MVEPRPSGGARPTLLLAALLPLWGCSGDGPTAKGALPDAIREARGSDSLPQGDIADAVISRFIPIGAELAPTLALLADSGFKVSPMTEGRPSSYTGDAAFIATQQGPSQSLCTEEWRILIDSRSGRVVYVGGYVIQHCL